MFMYLRSKFQVSTTILTSFRQKVKFKNPLRLGLNNKGKFG